MLAASAWWTPLSPAAAKMVTPYARGALGVHLACGVIAQWLAGHEGTWGKWYIESHLSDIRLQDIRLQYSGALVLWKGGLAVAETME